MSGSCLEGTHTVLKRFLFHSVDILVVLDTGSIILSSTKRNAGILPEKNI